MIGSSLGICSLFVICGNVLGLTRTTLSPPFSGDDIQSGDLLWRLAQLSRSDSGPLSLNSMSMQVLASLDNDDEQDADTRSILEINQKEGVDSYLLEGDIRLSSEQLSRLERNLLNETRQKRQADKTVALWANNKIFYYFDDSVGPRRRRLVRKTLAYLSARTCLDFVENGTYTNRIRVFFGNGCYSSIGMTGGEQDLSLGKGCYTMGTVAHEFMHALGVWHMHMRDDRDDYISVDLSGVPPRSRYNYEKLFTESSINYTPYEYGSVMHYDAQSFAYHGYISLVPKEAKYLRTMGSQMVSFLDIMMVNVHYNCSGHCANNSTNCTNGGVPSPRNCDECICPSGYGGRLCDQKAKGCGSTLKATSKWTSETFAVGDSSTDELRESYSLCNHWIQAPNGKKIQIRVQRLKGVSCMHGCWKQAIEPKVLIDQRIINPRICCPGQLNRVLTSANNPTAIVSYNNQRRSTFTFQYRFV